MRAFTIFAKPRHALGQVTTVPKIESASFALASAKPFTDLDKDFQENVGHMVVRKDGSAIALFGLPIKPTQYFWLHGGHENFTYVPLFVWDGPDRGKVIFQPMQEFTAQWSLVDPSADQALRARLSIPVPQPGADPQGTLYTDVEATNQLISSLENSKWAFDAAVTDGDFDAANQYLWAKFWGAQADVERAEAIIRTLASLGLLSEDRAEWFLENPLAKAKTAIVLVDGIVKGTTPTSDRVQVGTQLLALADEMSEDFAEWVFDSLTSATQVYAAMTDFSQSMAGLIKMLEESSLALTTNGRAMLDTLKNDLAKIDNVRQVAASSTADAGVNLPEIAADYVQSGVPLQGLDGLGVPPAPPPPRPPVVRPRIGGARPAATPKVQQKPPIIQRLAPTFTRWYGKFRSWLKRPQTPASKNRQVRREKKSARSRKSVLKWVGLKPNQIKTLKSVLGPTGHVAFAAVIFGVVGAMIDRVLTHLFGLGNELARISVAREAELISEAQRAATAAGQPDKWREMLAELKKRQVTKDREAWAAIVKGAGAAGVAAQEGHDTGKLPPDLSDQKEAEAAKRIKDIIAQAQAAGVSTEAEAGGASVWPWVIGGGAVVAIAYYVISQRRASVGEEA